MINIEPWFVTKRALVYIVGRIALLSLLGSPIHLFQFFVNIVVIHIGRFLLAKGVLLLRRDAAGDLVSGIIRSLLFLGRWFLEEVAKTT